MVSHEGRIWICFWILWYCGPSVKHQIGGEKGASTEKSWVVIITKSSENPMGLSMYAGPIETVEYIWMNIWCMLNWILSGVRQIASSKSQSMRGASHQPVYMGSCLTITHTYLPCLPSRWVSLRGYLRPSTSGVVNDG